MASSTTNRISDLQAMAVRWAQEPDSPERQKFGFWLNGELAAMYEQNLIKHQHVVDFNALVKILFDYILVLPVDEDATD